MDKPKIGIVIRKSLREMILSDADLARLKGFADVAINGEDRDLVDAEAAAFLEGMDGALTSWNSGALTPAILEGVPTLKIWAYGAGSLKGKICDEAWEKDIVVTSAAPSIADDVAEMTLAFMTMGLRHISAFSRAMREGARKPNKDAARTLFRRAVGVISASHVGQRVMRLLRPYDARILLYDPYVTQAQARQAYRAEKADLETIAREAEVVTIHAPKLDATYHLWNEAHFKLMRDDCVFINTSRGANIDEAALIAELQKGRFAAFLDVTDPEPPAMDSPLRHLPNVVLTPHCAGLRSHRIGAQKVEEFRRFFAGEDQVYRVTRDMMDRLA